MMRKILGMLEALFLVAIAIGLAFIILLKFDAFLDTAKNISLSEGNLEWFIYLTITGFLITYVMKRLILWEVHLTLGNPRKRRK